MRDQATPQLAALISIVSVSLIVNRFAHGRCHATTEAKPVKDLAKDAWRFGAIDAQLIKWPTN
jgi:hypothetical protein